MSERHASSRWVDLLAAGRLPRFAVICLGVWLNAADSLVTATIMPSVAADLGGYAYFSWAVAGFLVGAILAGASAGRISELLGLRIATMLAGLVFTLGCVLSALAPDMGIFLCGRMLQGAGSGWISGFAMVAIALLFPQQHIARVFAAVAAVWGVATVLGPLIGGIFAQTGHWRGVFWLFAAQALLFTIAAPMLLAGAVQPQRGAQIPLVQLVLLAFAVGSIALADTSAGPSGALALTALGLLLLQLLVRFDERASVRLLPRGTRDVRTVYGSGYAAMFALSATSMGLLIYGPALLQELRALSPLWAGYVVAAHAMAWTLGAFVVAGVTPATEGRWIRLGASCIVAGVVALTLVMRSAAVGWVVLAAATMGAGFGFSSSLMNRRVLAALRQEDRATGSSALIAVRETGGAVGAAIAGATANLAGFRVGITQESASLAAVWIFLTAIPIALVGAWMARRLSRAPAHPSH